ncbi:MAG: BT4734/BF3469 family protein [Verrucomicrobiales bacterium]
MTIHHSKSSDSTAPPSPALRVSFYRSVRFPERTKNVHLSEIAAMIADPGSNLKPATEKCRAAYQAAEKAGRPPKKDPVYDAAKKALPAVMLSGVCAGNTNEQMVSHSGLVQLDLDDLRPADLPLVRGVLKADPHVALLFVSPSGCGLKAAVRVGLPSAPLAGAAAIGDYHSRAFVTATAYARNTLALCPDTGVKDARRMCFLSHDPDVFLNLEATPLPVPTAATEPKTAGVALHPNRQNEEAKPFTRRSPEDRKAFAARAKNAGFTNLKRLEFPALLRELGWFLKEESDDKTQRIFFRCPWEYEHTTPNGVRDMMAIRSMELTGAVDWGIRCLHGHCADRGLLDVLEAAEEEESGIVNRFCGVGAMPAELDRRRNDVFNADVFVRLHGDKVRFLHDEKMWMVWNDTYWKADTDGAILRLAKTVADELWKMDDDPKWRTHAVNSGNARRLEDMLKVAACDQRVAAMRADFDRDPFLLGCPNGTVDLRTGVLRPANPASNSEMKVLEDLQASDLRHLLRFSDFF